MKKLILTTAVSLFALNAIAAPSLFFRIKNERSVKYSISKGHAPQPVDTEIRGYTNVFKDDEVKFRWVTVYGSLGKYATKGQALAALKDEMTDVKAGVFSNALMTQINKDCKRANSTGSDYKFNQGMKYVNELIERGFYMAGSYKIFTSVNDQFEEVYQPKFTVKVPCNFWK